MIGVQIGTHDLFYVWTCQSIMLLLECTIKINQDTGFAHVGFLKNNESLIMGMEMI